MEVTKILYNGQILTGTYPYVIEEAVAIAGDQIWKVGSNEDILKLKTEITECIDCMGNTVLPGLCDAHCHGAMSGNMLYACNLFDIPESVGAEATVKEIKRRLKDYLESHPDVVVLRGIGFNQFAFDGNRRPSRLDLDEVCNDRPIVLESFCQHAIWTNTCALQQAQITKETPQPSSGSFEVETDGTPSGMFHDMEARALILNNLPNYDFSVEEYKNIILHYQNQCVSVYGVTLIQECKLSHNAVEAYKELAREGKLQMRVRGVYCIDQPSVDDEMNYAITHQEEDKVEDLFQINTVKYFLEGFFAMLEPFTDEFNQANGNPQGYAGETFFDDETVKASFKKALEASMQIHIHAMGDKTVRQSIEALEYAQNLVEGNHRNVIAHIMSIHPDDISRLGQNHIIGSVQPRWMVYDNDVAAYVGILGEERAKRVYPCKSLMESGSTLAFGTDYPVTPPPNPFHGIQCAITRQVFPGAPDYEESKNRVLQETVENKESITLSEAIHCTSYNGAYEMFLENITGTILPGYSAELVVLDRNLMTCPVKEIWQTEVQRTYFKGQCVYEK